MKLKDILDYRQALQTRVYLIIRELNVENDLEWRIDVEMDLNEIKLSCSSRYDLCGDICQVFCSDGPAPKIPEFNLEETIINLYKRKLEKIIKNLESKPEVTNG